MNDNSKQSKRDAKATPDEENTRDDNQQRETRDRDNRPSDNDDGYPQRQNTKNETPSTSTHKQSSNTDKTAEHYERHATDDPNVKTGTITYSPNTQTSLYPGRAQDLASTQHVAISDSKPESLYMSWYVDVITSGFQSAPTGSYAVYRDETFNVFEVHPRYVIHTQPECVLVYNTQRSPYNTQDPFKPLDSSKALLFMQSVESWKYGTSMVNIKLSDTIMKYLPKRATIIPSIYNETSLVNYTEQRMGILSWAVSNRAILYIESLHADKNAFDGDLIQNTVPNLSMNSPLLRSQVPVEPLWFNQAMHRIIQQYDVKYGKISSELDARNVTRFNIYGLPIDHITASMYNFNLQQMVNTSVPSEDVIALMAAHAFEFDSIDIVQSAYSPVPPWYDDTILTRTTAMHALYPGIVNLTHKLNVEYLTKAMPFTISTQNSIMMHLSKDPSQSRDLIEYFNRADKGITSANINDWFASGYTPAMQGSSLEKTTVHPMKPEYVIDMLAISLSYQVNPNVFGRLRGAIAARFLAFAKVHYNKQYRIFCTNFGFRYKIVNGENVYDKVTDPSESMDENADYLTGEWFPSLFSGDAAIASKCPSIHELIKDMDTQFTDVPDTRAINAKFPRFQNATHCNPFTMLRDSNSSSTTGGNLAMTVMTFKNILLNILKGQTSNKYRSAFIQFFDYLFILCEELGASCDGYVYFLCNNMANFPFNFFSNFSAKAGWTPNPYCVIDRTSVESKNSSYYRTYPLVTNDADSRNVRIAYYTMIWTLLGGVNSSFQEALGNGRNGVQSGIQPVIPSPGTIVNDSLDWIRLINDLSAVEALTQWVLNKNKTIPGFELALLRLREGINSNFITESVYKKVRNFFKEMLGKGNFSADMISTVFGNKERATRLLDPVIRAKEKGVLQPFRPNIDPPQFEEFQDLLSPADRQRMEIGLSLIENNMMNICTGILLYQNTSPKFDVTQATSIPTTIKRIDYTPALIVSTRNHDKMYLRFLIDDTYYDAKTLKDVAIVLKSTGNINHAHLELLENAVLLGENVYVSLPNLRYIPTLTTNIDDFNFKESLLSYMDKPDNYIHQITFFDNTMNPNAPDDMLATGNMPLRMVWHSSSITSGMSCRGIVNKEGVQPADTKLPTGIELDMGKLNQVTRMPEYTNGVAKLQARTPNMYNQVLTLAENEISAGKLQYRITRTRDVIQV